MKRPKLLSGIMLAMFLFFSANAFCDEKYNDIPIRVCIADDKSSISLAVKGEYRVCEIKSDKVLMQNPYLSAIVTANKNGVKIGNKELGVQAVKIRPFKNSEIYVDDRRFRGDIDIVVKEAPKFIVINHINLEDYLYGVLYHEVSHLWPMEALKAQAIAARSFALYQARENKAQPYDLRNDIYSQVYGGKTSEKWSTTKAVNATRGKILVYKSDIFPSYYHATCAGCTEDAANLWNIDIPPLKGVECGYCKGSPHYKWSKELPLWVLGDRLTEGGYKIGDISSVSIISKNKSGRVDKIEIKDNNGVSVILTGKDFRQIIGPNEVRSTKFDLSTKWDNIILNGFGWGHGVGMCQWGAYGMASKRKNAQEILQHYYPGVEITTIDKLNMNNDHHAA